MRSRRRSPRCPPFRDGYARRRCLLSIDNFFEWKAIKGQKTKQPYAIAMKSGEPFALAAIWENWRPPGADEWLRTFCILTTNANELVSDIHDRMPMIIPRDGYDRWLANIEPDARDLLVPYPSGLMTMWPVSTRVSKPDNDDPSILGGSGHSRRADVALRGECTTNQRAPPFTYMPHAKVYSPPHLSWGMPRPGESGLPD